MKDSHLTLRLPVALARLLARSAQARGIPKSQLAREAVGRYLAPVVDESPAAASLTAADLAQRWRSWPRLAPAEVHDLGRDIDAARADLPPMPEPWS